MEHRETRIFLVKVLPGENELQALAEGGLRVLRGEEQEKSYPYANASVELEVKT